jgi:hypothetical protein
LFSRREKGQRIFPLSFCLLRLYTRQLIRKYFFDHINVRFHKNCLTAYGRSSYMSLVKLFVFWIIAPESTHAFLQCFQYNRSLISRHKNIPSCSTGRYKYPFLLTIRCSASYYILRSFPPLLHSRNRYAFRFCNFTDCHHL